MKFYAKELIKMLLAKEDLTQKELAKILTENTDKNYTPDGFSRKLSRGTITYNEIVSVTDILGYDIKIEKREQG